MNQSFVEWWHEKPAYRRITALIITIATVYTINEVLQTLAR